LGGEKLNFRRIVLIAGLAVCAIIIVSPLSAQTGEPVGEESPLAAAQAPALPAENTIFLGEDAPQVPAGGASSVWAMVRMVRVLALAALAIYGVVFFFKRLARPPEARDPHLKVLASAPLGSGAFTAVIALGSKAWLVGGGDGGVSLIAEIDEQEALESLLIDDARKEAESRRPRLFDFRSLLRNVGRGQESGGPGNPRDPHADAIRKQRDRLKGL
jgi:flagellar protein FliO/FliZ